MSKELTDHAFKLREIVIKINMGILEAQDVSVILNASIAIGELEEKIAELEEALLKTIT